MDTEELRSILSRSRAGIFALIDTAIKIAAADHSDELRRRRDSIVESLYVPPPPPCPNCNAKDENDAVPDNRHFYSNSDDEEDININNKNNNNKHNKIKNNDKINSSNVNDNKNIKNRSKSPLTPESNHRNEEEEEEEDLDPYGGLFDDEQTRILNIKEQLEDPNQSEDAVVELLQNLSDMDITFQALKETDIGRHVNGLRKHPSGEVRRLVKQLVRKWKETVDEWVKVNQPQATSNLIADGDSPQQSIPKNQQNGHHQVPDFGYSPNPRNGSSSAEKNHAEYEPKPKPVQSVPRKEAPSRPPQSVPKSSSAPPANRPQRETVVDDERLNSARRRLQENYQEAENAKRQRTIQVMDIHEIPKPKNAFFAKNKGGFQGRHHR